MKQLKRPLAGALLCLWATGAWAEALWKVEVTDTNNFQTLSVESAEELSLGQDPALMAYVMERVRFAGHSDPDLFIEVMDWVASQWQHDGMNQPPAGMSSLEILKSVHEQGERYRCVEYGQVMADILSAMGHHSRQIGLQSTDVAYGGFAMGHVATEVWSNALNKWVFFDPQFSIYAQHQGQYLNVYDIFALKQAGQFEAIDFVITPAFAAANALEPQSVAKEYAGFLGNYLGFHTSSRHLYGKRQRVYLMMEAQQPALTFQGMGSESLRVFTRMPEVAYPQLNQTLVSLTALPSDNDDGNFQKVMETFDIQTNEDYLAHMWRVAARGELSMQLHSAMNGFDRFQVRHNGGPWQDLEGDRHSLTLSQGANRFEARSVSALGVLGPVTFIEVHYGPDESEDPKA
ncbi:hypothetical protein [Ferrimonas balearica]|uniref:hypothetical protein n=1 Tax=Ferrimonas balearica TaxID=44012 RepID=UPI001C9906F8|nr:hypothetical protein [Ferrimonas balearica]MBY5991494.1 hypothetical protein [Ferrimonas balearica]